MKIKIVLLIGFLLLSSKYALWKNSTLKEADFTTVYNKVDNVRFTSVESVYEDNIMNTLQYDNDMSSLADLYEAADLVAVVQPFAREQKAHAVNTQVEIKKNIKSTHEVGEKISLFEQYYIYYDVIDGKEFAEIFSSSGYIPMQMEKEYLVFLKKSEGYTSNQYGFLSLLYGKFPYLDKPYTSIEIAITREGVINCSFEDLYSQDVALFNISEEETSEDESYEKKSIENMIKYNDYKKDYLEKLQDFIDLNYDIEQLL